MIRRPLGFSALAGSVLGFVLGYVPGAATAAVYYVDANSASCSASGPGTASSPYCSISAALAAHRGPGTTIVVRPGTYLEQVDVPASGTSSNPFVIQGQGPGVVVDGSDDLSQASMWTLYSGNVWRASGVTWSPKQVFVDGGRLTLSSASPSSLPSRTFRFVSGSGLYVNLGGGNPGTHQTRASRREYCILVSDQSWVTISGFEATRADEYGIYVASGSANCVVSGNHVTFARHYGIGASGAPGVLVASNVVSDNQDHGILLGSGSNGSTIQDNESFRNADPLVRRANGIYLGETSGCLIRRNRVHDNQDTGLQINSSSNNNVSVENISWNNGDHGFDHLGASGTVHRHDVSYGNFKDGFSIEGNSPGTSLYNCISVNNGLTTAEFDLWVDSGSASGFTSDYNLFWNSNGREPVKYISTIYPSVGAYSAATGKDKKTLQSNPKFVNAGAGDFHLLRGSPAIDNASSSVSNWPVLDAEGQPRFDDSGTPNTGAGSIPYADRGALEFFEFIGTFNPPVVAAPNAASGAEGYPLTVAVTASDPDGAITSLTADLSALPPGNNGVFTAGPGNTSGTLLWTPSYADSRSTPYSVTFTASNANSGSVSTAISVSNVDRAPAVSAPAAAAARAGHLLTISVLASDPDGDGITSLTADLAALPEGSDAAFTAGSGNSTGTLTWTPAMADVRTAPYSVAFGAANAISGVASCAITVTDLDGAPSVVAPAAASGTEGATLSVPVTAADPDGDPITAITADLSGLPAGNGAHFSSTPGNTQGTLSWAPAAGDARALPYPVVFSASNALSGSASTAITVGAAPSPGSNLVGNPSFEATTDGWSGNGGATLQRVAGGSDGAFSLEMRGPASGTGKFGVNDSPNWVTRTEAVGESYRFTAWVRSASAAGAGMLRVREYLGSTQEGSTRYSPAVTLSPAWQMVTTASSATVAGSTFDFQVVDQPAVPAEVFQTDNISIQLVPGGSAAARGPARQALSGPSLAPVLAPNPSHPDATIAFTTSSEGRTQVRIYDVRGRFVRSLVDEAHMPPGRHVIRFDGQDAAGKWLPAGIYFYRLQTQEGSVRGRIVRVP
ncbi:MAG TPA: right-handed parallel beta-helix repeat-containing protein [Candidatus Limnocylindrales bacterium]|nr:right-handed parallel beta-helix repeat-containing protein [Candidatus Limnocylindrales bacterium]